MRKAWPAGRQGYFTGPVMIILAMITLFVAITLFLNANLLKGIKNESTPSSQPALQAQSSPTPNAASPTNTSGNEKCTEKASSIFDEQNWENYKNEEFQIQFKYPKNSRLSDKFLAAVFHDGGSVGNGIQIFYCIGNLTRREAFPTELSEGLVIDMYKVNNKENKSLSDIVNDKYLCGTLGSEPGKIEKIDLGGKEAYKIICVDSLTKSPQMEFGQIFYQKDSSIFNINYNYRGKNQETYQQIYNKFLSTFKFLD